MVLLMPPLAVLGLRGVEPHPVPSGDPRLQRRTSQPLCSLVLRTRL
nr:MAG TPA: hypothetical protein [Caudoviricetes sp.]